jgi:hypothetical protein
VEQLARLLAEARKVGDQYRQGNGLALISAITQQSGLAKDFLTARITTHEQAVTVRRG